MADHEHTWSYTGVRFRDGRWPLGGTQDCLRYYGQHFFCVGCLESRIDRLPYMSRTSEPILFDATPATAAEFPVECDRSKNDGEEGRY